MRKAVEILEGKGCGPFVACLAMHYLRVILVHATSKFVLGLEASG